jgi:16S rRNA (uracil1498-N3)-methyltransferase
LPAIEAAQPLLDYLGKPAPHTPRLVFEPQSATPPDIAGLNGGAAVEIAIGPEGGFTSSELEAFRVAGFCQTALGPRILRSETAAIAAVVWLQAHIGDM